MSSEPIVSHGPGGPPSPFAKYNVSRRQVVYILIGIAFTAFMYNQLRATSGIRVDTVWIEANGRKLSALVSRPKDTDESSPLPGTVVFHGFSGSKEMMRPFTELLARLGIITVTVDQQGHGLSEGKLGDLDDDDGLALDGVKVVEYLRALPDVDSSRVAILGHSMGAGTAISTSLSLGDISATVLLGTTIGNYTERVNATFPSNFWLGVGAFDELMSLDSAEENFIDFLEEGEVVVQNSFWGSFENGTARGYYVEPTDHILEVINPSFVRQSTQWILTSLTGSIDDDISTFIFVFDQLVSYDLATVLLLLLPVAYPLIPITWFGGEEKQEDDHQGQSATVDDFDDDGDQKQGGRQQHQGYRVLGHGFTIFASFMLGLPFGILISFPFIAVGWYVFGSLMFYFRLPGDNRRERVVELFKYSPGWLKTVAMFLTLFFFCQIMFLFISWDLRFVIPFIGAVTFRRFLLFIGLWIPGVPFFTLEIDALGGEGPSVKSYFKEAGSRVWLIITFLLIYYVPVILGTPFLTGLVGFLAFFVVGFVPVMLVVSLLTLLLRFEKVSQFEQAIIVSGLIGWMLAVTFPFVV